MALAWLVLAALFAYPLSVLLTRAGLSPWWALAALLPFGPLVLVWVLAMRRWPGDDLPSRF
ncbi:MAG: hypothetical protein AAFV86_19765 [Pseudomonadota bacterium]